MTLHVRMFVQGHHNNHSTDFYLTPRGKLPDNPGAHLSSVTYPGVFQRDFIAKVADEMDVVLTGELRVHQPRGWVDHVSYDGLRRAES